MATLLSIEKTFGPDQIIFIGVELTKLFECHYRDTVRNLSFMIHNQSVGLRGEVTIVVPPWTYAYNIELSPGKMEKREKEEEDTVSR
jgi:16S rRNA C1402 (ribose-2'-O) methylase RsmI